MKRIESNNSLVPYGLVAAVGVCLMIWVGMRNGEPAAPASPAVAAAPAVPALSSAPTPKPVAATKPLSRAERRRMRREAREAADRAREEAQAQQEAQARQEVQTPAFELASLQSPGIAETDPLVDQFAAQIRRMAAKSEKPDDSTISLPEGIARMTILMHDKMAERGVDEDYLSILTHVNDSVPDGVQLGKHSADVFAAYVVLRAPAN